MLFSASLSLLCDKGSQQNRTNLDWIGSVGSMKADMEKMKKSALALKEDSSNIPDVLWMVSIDLSIQYHLKVKCNEIGPGLILTQNKRL